MKSQTCGAYEAKTRFSELIQDAAAGITTVVTKNGRPVAEIAPIRLDGRSHLRAVGERIRRLGEEFHAQNRAGLSPENIREMRDTERRLA